MVACLPAPECLPDTRGLTRFFHISPFFEKITRGHSTAYPMFSVLRSLGGFCVRGGVASVPDRKTPLFCRHSAVGCEVGVLAPSETGGKYEHGTNYSARAAKIPFFLYGTVIGFFFVV